MKAIGVVLAASVLLAMSTFAKQGCLFAQGSSHGGASRGFSGGSHGYGRTLRGNYSNRPTYGVNFVDSGREIESTSASSRWLWVERPSQRDLDRQKARDDAFYAALEEYRKTFPFRLTP